MKTMTNKKFRWDETDRWGKIRFNGRTVSLLKSITKSINGQYEQNVLSARIVYSFFDKRGKNYQSNLFKI